MFHDQTSDGPDRGREEITVARPDHVRVYFRSNQMEPMLFVYDGRRLLVHDPAEFRPWILYDAPAEHPDQFSMVSDVLSAPGSAAFADRCPSARLVGRRTMLGRDAVGYHCAAQHHADGSSESGGTGWFDRKTGLPLFTGHGQSTTIDEHPHITGETFSTEPPAGAKVEHFAARPRGRPAPDFHLKRVDTDGTVRLSDYANRPLVLAFFSSDIYFDQQGEECRRCLPALLDLQRLSSGGTRPAVLAVQEGEEGKPGYPLIPDGLRLPVGNDPGFDVARSYGVENQVAFALIGSDGTVHQVIDRAPSTRDLEHALTVLK